MRTPILSYSEWFAENGIEIGAILKSARNHWKMALEISKELDRKSLKNQGALMDEFWEEGKAAQETLLKLISRLSEPSIEKKFLDAYKGVSSSRYRAFVAELKKKADFYGKRSARYEIAYLNKYGKIREGSEFTLDMLPVKKGPAAYLDRISRLGRIRGPIGRKTPKPKTYRDRIARIGSVEGKGHRQLLAKAEGENAGTYYDRISRLGGIRGTRPGQPPAKGGKAPIRALAKLTLPEIDEEIKLAKKGRAAAKKAGDEKVLADYSSRLDMLEKERKRRG